MDGPLLYYQAYSSRQLNANLIKCVLFRPTYNSELLVMDVDVPEPEVPVCTLMLVISMIGLKKQ